ncbi:MAG TPA: glycosyltransferase family 39 protein [Pseudolabrys sp.]|nr:glycosyltransferase family 39 protein [Pseudolabrys sp.]
MRSAFPSADRIAVFVLAAVAVIAALTFRDYGLGWDDYTHSQYGDLLLKLYGTGFADTRALSFVNLYKYGGGFDMAAALAAKVLPFDLFETRRLVGAAIGILGLFVTWRIGRRIGGPLAGLVALVLLAACPLYYGHMFINAKDAPFAMAMAVLTLGLVRAFDEYPQPGARTVVLAGVGFGLAFGSRVLAGVAAPAGIAALAFIAVAEGRARGFANAAQRAGQFLWTLLPALGLGYLIMGLLWPWSVQSPLNPIYAAEYFDTFFEKPWEELYEGRLIAVPDMPASYLPHLFMLKLPLIMLALGAIGTVGAIAAVTRTGINAHRRAGLIVLIFAAIFPVLLAMAARPALYNGVRHFVFVVPPFAVLGGLAAQWIAGRVRVYGAAALGGLAAILVAGIAWPVAGMIRLHPYDYTYFNALAGGVKAAQHDYMLDYWGLAFKQAADALRARLAAAGAHPPQGRRWVVAICGPQSSAREQLGPQFETTFDSKTADFVMSLGTFYCRHLNGPILASIERDGVVYAVVYDVRGTRPQPLLTLPPP